jgi:Gas vesicle synthesis protein GvpL/GvpF
VSPLVYVYAIAASQQESPIRGIGGSAVRWIGEGELYAAASDVREDEFNEEALNAGLADMQWLGPRAVAHQEVNQRLHDRGEALIPLAFGTVFRDDTRVREMLRGQAASLRERLDRVRGCSEWVVTVHATAAPDTVQVETVQRMQQQIAEASPGRAHLLRRQLADVEKQAARQLEADAVNTVTEALRGAAQEAFAEPMPNVQTADRTLLRMSVLVRRSDEEQFVRVVEGLQSDWLSVVLTGPWAPYRFGGLEHVPAIT